MKIGILTFHNTMNYGSFLQALGTYNALVKLGYDCEILDYECKAIEDSEFSVFKQKKKGLKSIPRYFFIIKKQKKKYEKFRRDLYTYMKVSKRYTRDTIKNADNIYDAFLVGSDILWDLKLTNYDMTYFLDFTNNHSKKFAFSTSIGGQWNERDAVIIKKLLHSFQKISLREETSAKWLEKLMPDKKIYAVCDPTMLCNSIYWDSVAETGKKLNGKYVLVYFTTEEILKNAKEYAEYHGYKVVCIGFGFLEFNIKYVTPESIGDFLALVKGAMAVFTGSYHGFLFSLYFNKPVFVYYRDVANHNVRLLDVLKRLDIEESCTYSLGCNGRLNYVDINKRIEEWRSYSFNVLGDYWS